MFSEESMAGLSASGSSVLILSARVENREPASLYASHMMRTHATHLILSILLLPHAAPAASTAGQVVTIDAGDRTLYAVLYRPIGPGPFPAVLYNHGSAPGMLNNQAFEMLGPLFAGRGWAFFAPYRRGQGLSAAAGPYIGDEIAGARRRALWQGAALAVPMLILAWVGVLRRQPTRIRAGIVVAVGLCAVWAINVGARRAAASTMVRLLDTEQFADQLAALQWLQQQPFVTPERIAAAGNSFGGVESVLGAERADYCAAIDAAGGAESWAAAPGLRVLMQTAVRRARAPIFFIQAENDFDLSPSRSLAAAMHEVGKEADVKIYASFGQSRAEGHSFAWRGAAIWQDDVFAFLAKHCGGIPVRSFLGVLQPGIDGAESCEVSDELPLGHCAGDVDRQTLDAAPPAVAQGSAHALIVRERELPVRQAAVQRHNRGGGALRRRS